MRFLWLAFAIIDQRGQGDATYCPDPHSALSLIRRLFPQPVGAMLRKDRPFQNVYASNTRRTFREINGNIYEHPRAAHFGGQGSIDREWTLARDGGSSSAFSLYPEMRRL